MNSTTQTKGPIRDGVAVALAVALGPVFILIANSLGLIYGTGALFYFLCCALIVPCLTLLSVRFRFLTWQLAVLSLTLSCIGGAVPIGAMGQKGILRAIFVFWAVGSLLSSPIPIYLLLRSATPQRRYVFGFIIVVVGVVLWLAMKRITG